jgi:hypothetical protein
LVEARVTLVALTSPIVDVAGALTVNRVANCLGDRGALVAALAALTTWVTPPGCGTPVTAIPSISLSADTFTDVFAAHLGFGPLRITSTACAVGEVEMAITTLLTRSPPKLSFTAALPVIDVACHILRVEQVASTWCALRVVVISFSTLVTKLAAIFQLARALQVNRAIRPLGNTDW